MDATDPRFRGEKFAAAVAIFPNSDVKYDVNKTRARDYSRRLGVEALYSVARDVPSADALRESPNIRSKKREWLQRHDRECGDLYGMLPLAVGMPVAMTDHIDRSPDKQILRGRVGVVHSWVLDPAEDSVARNGVRIL